MPRSKNVMGKMKSFVTWVTFVWLGMETLFGIPLRVRRELDSSTYRATVEEIEKLKEQAATGVAAIQTAVGTAQRLAAEMPQALPVGQLYFHPEQPEQESSTGVVKTVTGPHKSSHGSYYTVTFDALQPGYRWAVSGTAPGLWIDANRRDSLNVRMTEKCEFSLVLYGERDETRNPAQVAAGS